MALIPGLEYDIFIRYRHNDNLDGTSAGSGQGWVTDFVQNLEKELRSTLKDSLTIYFDLKYDQRAFFRVRGYQTHGLEYLSVHSSFDPLRDHP